MSRLLQEVVLVFWKEVASSGNFSDSYRVTASLPVLLWDFASISPGMVGKIKLLFTFGNSRFHLYQSPIVKFSTQACIQYQVTLENFTSGLSNTCLDGNCALHMYESHNWVITFAFPYVEIEFLGFIYLFYMGLIMI